MMTEPTPRMSAIYEGTVTHTRVRPRRHKLRYRVWYLLADLDELDALDHDIPGFSNEGRGLASFRSRDHGPRDGSPLRPWIEQHLAQAHVDLDGGAIRILAFPRILGYAFNPISVWFCHGPMGELRAVMFEVSNTFGEWHHYLAPVAPTTGLRATGEQVVHVRFPKELYVSPFITMAASYDIRVRVPDDRMTIGINLATDEGHLLSASFEGARSPITGRSLARVMLRYPLLTLKVIFGIHWEAMKLWRKDAPVQRHGSPPPVSLTLLPLVDDAAHGSALLERKEAS